MCTNLSMGCTCRRVVRCAVSIGKPATRCAHLRSRWPQTSRHPPRSPKQKQPSHSAHPERYKQICTNARHLLNKLGAKGVFCGVQYIGQSLLKCYRHRHRRRCCASWQPLFSCHASQLLQEALKVVAKTCASSYPRLQPARRKRKNTESDTPSPQRKGAPDRACVQR